MGGGVRTLADGLLPLRELTTRRRLEVHSSGASELANNVTASVSVHFSTTYRGSVSLDDYVLPWGVVSNSISGIAGGLIALFAATQSSTISSHGGFCAKKLRSLELVW